MRYRLHIPQTLEQALEIKRKTDGTYLAAGTDILVSHRHKEDLIALEKIPGLCSIEEDKEYFRIGALVTFDSLEKSVAVKGNLPALWQAACSVAGPQIRNRATIGGNIGCFSPASDAVTALVALDAEVELFNGRVYREKLENLQSIDNGAIICAVLVPKRFDFSAFEKVGKRNAMSVSVINMALARSGSEVRIATGCVGPHVILCKDPSEVAGSIRPINDRWGTVEYKQIVAGNLLEKLSKEAGL